METSVRAEVDAMLRRRFSSVPFEFSTEGTLIARLPAPYPELGVLEIHEDGIEAIAEVGDVTHGHFYPYDKKSPGAAAEVAENLGAFIADLFEDKICMFTSSLGGGHGKNHGQMAKAKARPKVLPMVWAVRVDWLTTDAPIHVKGPKWPRRLASAR